MIDSMDRKAAGPASHRAVAITQMNAFNGCPPSSAEFRADVVGDGAMGGRRSVVREERPAAAGDYQECIVRVDGVRLTDQRVAGQSELTGLSVDERWSGDVVRASLAVLRVRGRRREGAGDDEVSAG